MPPPGDVADFVIRARGTYEAKEGRHALARLLKASQPTERLCVARQEHVRLRV